MTVNIIWLFAPKKKDIFYDHLAFETWFTMVFRFRFWREKTGKRQVASRRTIFDNIFPFHKQVGQRENMDKIKYLEMY